MKIYQIAGKQYAVIGEELFELSRASEWDGLQVFLTTPTQPEAPVRRKYGSGKLKKRTRSAAGRRIASYATAMAISLRPVPTVMALWRQM